MIVLEVDRVEVDHCVGCGGTWLDAGELELLLDGAANRDELLDNLAPASDTQETSRVCPICDKKMQKVSCGSEQTVLLDKCARGDGIWFDRGELRQVVDMGAFPAENRVYELLNDVFGRD
jgi:Zn-finger nucleic acid-binding protein